MKDKNNYWQGIDFIYELVNQLPAAIFWKDKDSVFLGCNQYFANLAGLSSPKDIIGKTDFDLPWGKHEAELYQKDDKEVIKRQKPKLNIEESQTLADGRSIVLLTNKIPMFSKESHEVLGVLCIYHDITSRKQLEQSLEIAKNQAETANRAKTEFIANMSHDIRTPLSGVVGMSELLEEIASDENQKKYAESINQCAEQLLGLLNGILDVVSADNVNENDIRLETFLLKQCLQGLIELERPTTSIKGLTLTLDVDERAPALLISDRTKIHRILLNLLGNAIKFTKKGGVTIKVDFLSQKGDEASLRFSVIDTGIGIAKDKLKKVFERFYRVDPSYKGVYTGHGLGLHIAQAYAKLLGSQIKVTSEEGKGTTFYFDLTCKIGKEEERKDKPKNVEPKVMAPTHTATGDGPQVLLVEDNTIALQMAETFASRVRFQFTSAIDGESALALAKSKSFDLIITDLGLPDISGLQFTKLYREWEIKANKKPVPIVGLTAHVSEQAKEECRQAGMTAVFSKPVNLEMMKAMQQFIKPIDEIQIITKKEVQETGGKLGMDLPDTEAELFKMQDFPLLDYKSGIQNSGSEDLLKQMLGLMNEQELPKDVEAMKKAYAEKDWSTIEKIAHKMKGGALYIGTIRMQHACQYIERYIKAGHTKLCAKLYEQLLQVIEETRAEISERKI